MSVEQCAAFGSYRFLCPEVVSEERNKFLGGNQVLTRYRIVDATSLEGTHNVASR